MLPDPAAPVSIPSIPKMFLEGKIVDVAENKQRRCLKESGQWFENVDRTHLELVSIGKIGLLKWLSFCMFPGMNSSK